MMDSEQDQLVCIEMGPSTTVNESNWNVRIKELLILYFLETIYNSMNLVFQAAVLCVYHRNSRLLKAAISTAGCLHFF